MITRPILGYWSIRGLGSNIRYQLAYCGVDYNMDWYFPDDGGRRWWDKGRDKWTLGLEFANLPWFIHGDAKICESLAIHHYIAEVWDQGLLGKNPQDKALVDMLTNLIRDMRMKIVGKCYQKDSEKANACEEYKDRLPPIIKQLGRNDFLVGDYPTTVDFYFYETVQLMCLVSDQAVLKEYPALVGYCQRFKELKGVKDYMDDPFCMEKDFFMNAPFAKITGKQQLY